MINYKEIARDYLNESDYFNNASEFIEHFNMSIDIKKLEFYIKVESNRINKDNNRKFIKELFTNNTAVQFQNEKNPNRVAIFHPCTKENNNKFQVSFIDEKGAEMDIARETIEEITEEFLRYYSRYTIIENKIN